MKQQIVKQGRMTFVLVLLGLTTPALAQDFALSVSGVLNSIALQPDGKIFVIGPRSLGGQPVPPAQELTRLNQDGTLDGTFKQAVEGGDSCLSVQADGKILLAGTRLNSDGSWDKSFTNSGFGGGVFALIVQEDGKILKRGSGPVVQRFNSDGSRDASFNPPTSSGWSDGQDEYVMGLQPNGEILVGGAAVLVGQSALARLQPDGSLDTNFNAAVGHPAHCLALQPDGRWLVAAGGLARLNPDGSLHDSFNVGAEFNRTTRQYGVTALALQADGKLLVSGAFTNLAGQACTNFGRLNADGTLDTSFPSTTTYDMVDCLLLQQDGNLVFRGVTVVPTGPSSWTYAETLVRMTNPEPATQSLTTDGSTITWLRGGSSPEVWRTGFQYSTNRTDWIELGSGTRIAGGWQLTGLSLPPNSSIRAQGFVVGAPNTTDPRINYAASSWFVQSQTTAPAFYVATGSLGMSPDGFRFKVMGPVGGQLVISSSTDLKQWTDISTNLLETGVCQFKDPAASNASARYYRVRLQ